MTRAVNVQSGAEEDFRGNVRGAVWWSRGCGSCSWMGGRSRAGVKKVGMGSRERALTSRWLTQEHDSMAMGTLRGVGTVGEAGGWSGREGGRVKM